jgi:hypothetical protein
VQIKVTERIGDILVIEEMVGEQKDAEISGHGIRR